MVEQRESPAYKYLAFISYSHADRRAAEWLHKAIENYRIPEPLVGSAGRDGPVPKRLFPIFRDRDELASAANLSASIREALEASAYLIVLCSPSAARSRWVGQEIALFKQLGRAARIHAAIIEGEPGNAPTQDGCLPPALRFAVDANGALCTDRPEEPVAADLRPEGDGRAEGKLKLIAGLLGIPFNALRQRERHAARRRTRISQAIAASLIALALAAGIASWMSWRYQQEADDLRIPGLRVESRETTLDFSGWQPTTPAEIAGRVKKSFALSHDRYTIVKTQEYAGNYVHIVGTSSLIAPEIACHDCRIVPRNVDKATRAPNEFRVIFDISKADLEERIDLDYTTKYWNAFQTPDQMWAGIRILYQTEIAKFNIVFPADKHPRPDTIRYSFFDTRDHPAPGKPDATLETDEAGRVAKLSWILANPSTDRSYRVQWDWDRQ